MKAMEVTGRTVEEAVNKAVDQLGIKKSNAQIEVLCEPNQGLFGFIGSKDARVLVTKRYEAEEYLQKFIEKMLFLMELGGEVEVTSSEENYYVRINDSSSGILIGRRGRTLNEMQYLVNSILRRQFPGIRKRVIMDVGNYRQRRERTLNRLALKAAERVLATRRQVSLEPMTPQDRRIIHLALKEHGEVYTYSKGEEPRRQIVIGLR